MRFGCVRTPTSSACTTTSDHGLRAGAGSAERLPPHGERRTSVLRRLKTRANTRIPPEERPRAGCGSDARAVTPARGHDRGRFVVASITGGGTAIAIVANADKVDGYHANQLIRLTRSQIANDAIIGDGADHVALETRSARRRRGSCSSSLLRISEERRPAGAGSSWTEPLLLPPPASMCRQQRRGLRDPDRLAGRQGCARGPVRRKPGHRNTFRGVDPRGPVRSVQRQRRCARCTRGRFLDGVRRLVGCREVVASLSWRS